MCVFVCEGRGALRHLWASLIRECGRASLLFLRSHFKAGDIGGLFMGRERVGLSTNRTRSVTDKKKKKKVDEDKAGVICKQE